MGCGGSKQQDVATGNTVTRGLLRRSSSVAKGKRSEENGAEAIKVSDTAAVDDAKKAPTDGEPKLASKGSSSEEYFSSRREPDSVVVDAVAGGTEVAAVPLPGEHVDANANAKAGVANEASAVPELEKEEKKKDKEETTANNEKEEEEEEGKSVGKLSVDFKEALSLDEKEVEAAMEKENTEAARTTAEEKKNSGESKTAS